MTTSRNERIAPPPPDAPISFIVSAMLFVSTTYSMERRLAEIRDGSSISLGADEANI